MQAELIDWMGDDIRVANAARVSFDKQTEFAGEDYYPMKLKSKRLNEWFFYRDAQIDKGEKYVTLEDYGLIHFLAEHGHWTPLAHPHITLRMRAPVPIRTQCFKHKQGFVENEESRRYIKCEPRLYIPDEFRSAPDNAKQGSGGVHPDSTYFKGVYEDHCYQAIDVYQYMIEEGVAPEQARFVLPQGVEVNWYWTGSLAAYARFANLRNASDAQVEVQEMAQDVSDLIEPIFPVSWKAMTKDSGK